MSNTIDVLIVDDNDLFSCGLKILLENDPNHQIKIIANLRNGKEAVEFCRSYTPDVILMDIRMPVMDGVKATKEIRESHPEMKIVILTTFDDDEYVLKGIQYGAVGYLLKNINQEELVSAIVSVTKGSFLMSMELSNRIVNYLDSENESRAEPRGDRGETNFLSGQFDDFSHREIEVVRLLLHDHDNHEIANEMLIAEQTVKNYISRIYRKLGVGDRVHAIKAIKSRIGYQQIPR